MIRWALILFLFAHAWVHLVVWGLIPAMQPQVANPAHSWVLGDQRGVVTVMTLAVAALFAMAAIGLLFHAAWWGPVTVAAAGASILLVAVFPAAIMSVWIVAPLAINVALIFGMTWWSWPTRQILGG